MTITTIAARKERDRRRSQNNRAAAKARLVELHSRIIQLEAELVTANAAVESHLGFAKRVSDSLSQLQTALSEKTEQLATAEEELDQLRKGLGRLQLHVNGMSEMSKLALKILLPALFDGF